ncbi:hypothetical protein Rhe02_21390 [Rhizocola hellebori]|uniref:Chorismate-utilising enzyme C-terminal domain-containing protein n=1 Tax=Rhizocola hellebori TaxID=1392758 RepID=A0A8J3Q6A3_9ACTN|nr:anthranilate synthase component I family protein [Rhizocola hellebori]GIH04072.1 hypothetical protein Rhe02_21390 [Rhizocola hellebori]
MRLEWRVGDPGDPAVLAEEFLTEHGALRGDPICGASVLISAAASAVMIGGPKGAPTPAPAVPDMALVVYEHAGMQNPDHERGEWVLGPWRPSWTPSQHEAAVRRVHEAITRGDVYQVNVVGHASAEYEGDPMRALHRLTRLAGAKHAGVLGGDGWAVACASPETLLEVRGGRAITRPIKGTAPATPEGRIALLSSPKERAEHVMIVDLMRNDLAHVAVTGSVRVPQLFAVRKWSDLWQAESEVAAVLRSGVGFADLLRAVCPGGSVTGAPKLAALAEIERLEPVGRGPAMGAFGWIGPDHLNLGLTIRTAAVDEHRVHLWAGGGIVIDSDPAAEVSEAAAKAAPVKRALAGWR